MSGEWKNTLLNELARRGRQTVDADNDGWVLPDSTWDEPRMAALLASQPEMVVSWTVDNQGRFDDRFDQVVPLSAPLDIQRPARMVGSYQAEQPAGPGRSVRERSPIQARLACWRGN
ncbi:ATP-binding protein [Krasilnikovia sp. MM14-A1259]|uniref:ATP-binding protein n=1 Tax=Krasilnikovia sp. MM14-A1259 TaxID=3373539 RepID=UPI003814BA25